jgi:uncharacterized caspase-like protein
MRYLIFLLISTLYFTVYADDRAVKIKSSSQNREQRVALVIGNSDYRGVLSKLSNPINDATSMRDILKERGFRVIYSENTTKRDMRDSLNQFYSAIKKGGVGMFYFSGHGIEVDGQNYLIPVDAKIEAKSDTEFEAIALNKITKRMQSMGNRLNIIVLDACRNDPFSRSIGKGGLAKVEPIGMFVSYSTGAGSVASDGRAGGHGLFTESLIEHMKQELDLRDVFQQTRADVYTKSNKKQFPAIYDQTINGRFYFTQPTGSTPKITNYVQPTVVTQPEPRRESVSETKEIDTSIDISPYPVNKIPPKRTFVEEEEPEKYYHPPEDYSSVVGYD